MMFSTPQTDFTAVRMKSCFFLSGVLAPISPISPNLSPGAIFIGKTFRKLFEAEWGKAKNRIGYPPA
jgi:hypothetical protein